ncbi:MAG: potassium-transporting ATPase subunit C [Acidobacteria bacterium]|nr:MAG: potassium-transporting ATPase subunit C [Acidobacteriota bacterium]
MWEQILPALRLKLFMTVLLGVIYPLAITGICQVFFPYQANGSLIKTGGKVIGSELIGQNFSRPEYFQPRPSAAGSDGYDPTSSGGSNYGPTNQKLIDRVKASVEKFRKDNPDYQGPIPADLLTASASGLDPHISPASAEAQAPRVAKARGVSVDQVNRLAAQFTEGPELGILGEPRVNVLKLNVELEHQFPRR